MKTREEIRMQFFTENNGAYWSNNQEEPEIDYVHWLEDKLINKLTIPVVSTRYSKNDVRKYTDGWWITSFNKTRKQRIKLVGSFKTKQLAENEREALNGC